MSRARAPRRLVHTLGTSMVLPTMIEGREATNFSLPPFLRRASSSGPPVRLPVRYRKECATLLLLVAVAVEFVGVSIGLPILVQFAEELGVQESNAGLVFSVGAFAALLSSFWLPAVSDIAGRKPVLVMSLVGSALSYALQAAANSFELLLMAIFLGQIFGGTQPVAVAYISDIFSPSQRPRLIGMVPACASACYIIGPTLGGLLTKMSGSFRVPLFAASILVLVMLPIVQIFLPDPRVLISEREKHFLEKQQAEEHDRMRQSIAYTTSSRGSRFDMDESSSLISERSLLTEYSPLFDWRCHVCFWIQFFSIAAFSAFTTCIPLIFDEESFRLSGSEDAVFYTGLVIGCGAAFKSIGLIILFDRIQKRIGLPRTISLGALVAFVAFFILSFQKSVGGIAFGFALFSLGISVLQPAIFSYATVIAPQEYTARAIAVPDAAMSLGQVIGPIASTKLLSAFNYSILFQIFCAGLLVQLLISLSFLRNDVAEADGEEADDDSEAPAHSKDEFELVVGKQFIKLLNSRNYNLSDLNTQKAVLEMMSRSFPFLRESESGNTADIKKLMNELSIPLRPEPTEQTPTTQRRPRLVHLGNSMRASVISTSF